MGRYWYNFENIMRLGDDSKAGLGLAIFDSDIKDAKRYSVDELKTSSVSRLRIEIARRAAPYLNCKKFWALDVRFPSPAPSPSPSSPHPPRRAKRATTAS